MIIDTSALVAVARKEEQFESIFEAMFAEDAVIPSPVLVEFYRVTAFRGNRRDPNAVALISGLLAENVAVEDFSQNDAERAALANETFGSGNGRGGTLNMLDLMVYGIARRMNRPVLCTGRDFAATDIAIHPASRSW